MAVLICEVQYISLFDHSSVELHCFDVNVTFILDVAQPVINMLFRLVLLHQPSRMLTPGEFILVLSI